MRTGEFLFPFLLKKKFIPHYLLDRLFNSIHLRFLQEFLYGFSQGMEMSLEHEITNKTAY